MYTPVDLNRGDGYLLAHLLHFGQMLRLMGVPASRVCHARLRIRARPKYEDWKSILLSKWLRNIPG